MEQRARVTSKGQITIPAAVREALELREGDQVIFQVDTEARPPKRQAHLRRAPDLIALAGIAPPRPEWRGASWSSIRKAAREERATRPRE